MLQSYANSYSHTNLVELWVVVIELWVVAEPERLECCELKPNQPILMVVPVQTGSDGVRVVLELPFPDGVRVVLELPFPDGVRVVLELPFPDGVWVVLELPFPDGVRFVFFFFH